MDSTRNKENRVALSRENTTIVLVHGFYDTGAVFDKMRIKLQACDFYCIAPNLKPNTGKNGLEPLAKQVVGAIQEDTSHNENYVFIGFSMGGIISRYALMELGYHKKTSHFFSISSPHNGTYTAYLHPGKGTEQMKPNSSFLNHLDSLERKESTNMKRISFRTPWDLMIIPNTSSIWELAQNQSFSVALHPLMLKSDKVIDEIISILEESL